MTTSDGRHFWGGFWVTSLGTLASRVLGLVRDIATAALLGLGETGALDAFVIAFRIPNLPRRIFGEGALAASFLPVFTTEFERSPQRAWQLTSALFAWLAIVLSGLVLIGELICAAVWYLDAENSATRQLLGLSATMLPYMVFICLAAQASAALQARLDFKWAAIASSLLNVCWLVAVWGIAPRFAPDKFAQASVIAVAVLVSGVLQFVVQLPALARLGFRWDFDWRASRDAFWKVIRSMTPIALGMAVTQLNTLLDSLIAWCLSSETAASHSIPWLGHAVDYPMQAGAAAAIYFGERFYQLPIGLLGVAVATVVYPLLSRHAAQGQWQNLGDDLSLGLRIVLFLGLPASVGLMLIADPLTRLLFERGEFTAVDAARAAWMIATYSSGVWAYCAVPVLVRGYYAISNRITPARVGVLAMALNLTLNLTLVWFLAEVGLAVSTSIAAAFQVVLLWWILAHRTEVKLNGSALRSTFLKSLAAAAVMAAVLVGIQWLFPFDPENRRRQIWTMSFAIAGGAAAYLATAALLRMPELRLLISPRANKG